MKEEKGNAPEGFLCFLWVINNWRKYWKELTGFAIFCLILMVFVQIGGNFVSLIKAHFSSVFVKVIHFDQFTGEVTLEFDNQTRKPVPVESVYIAIAPTNNVPARPLPPHLESKVSVFDKNVIRVPSEAGVEFGPISGEAEMKGRPLRMVAIVAADSPPLVLQPGITTTNLTPRGNSFRDILDQYAEGASLDLNLHTSLYDAKGRLRSLDIPLGCYEIGSNHKGLRDLPNPRAVDILRKATISGTSRKQVVYEFTNTVEITNLTDDYYSFVIVNPSPAEMLLKFGQNISGLVPVLLVRNSISYACRFIVDLDAGEVLLPNFAAWVLSADGGKTIMNIPMAFSSNWDRIRSSTQSGTEFMIPLPTNNWQMLVDGNRWVTIKEGHVICKVEKQAWINLLPADEANLSLLFSNHTRIAMNNVQDDPSWTRLTNSVIPTNSSTYLIVQNEVAPDYSAFSTLVMTDPSDTNVTTESKSENITELESSNPQ